MDNINLPNGENPSALHATLASSKPHSLSQTVPWVPLRQILRMPSLSVVGIAV